MWKVGFTITNAAFSSFHDSLCGRLVFRDGILCSIYALIFDVGDLDTDSIGQCENHIYYEFQKKYTLQQNGVLTNSERSVSESCRLFCCFANACAPRVTSCDRSGPTVFLKHARHSCLRVPTSYVYPEFLASRSKPDTMTRQCKCWPKKMHFLCAICGVLCCVLQRRRCLAGRCFLPFVLFRYLPSMQGMR